MEEPVMPSDAGSIETREKIENIMAVSAEGRNFDSEFLYLTMLNMSALGINWLEFADTVQYLGLDLKVTFNTYFGKFVSKTEAIRNLMMAFIVVDKRGIRWDRPKFIERTNPKVVSFTAGFAKKISLILNDKPLKAEDLTLPRLVSCFPHIYARAKLDMYVMGKSRIVGEIPEYEDTGSAEFLVPLLFPGGSSLIPKSDEYDQLYAMWLDWAESFDEVIHNGKNPAFETKKTATKNEKADPKKVQYYSSLARSSDLLSDEFRIKTLKKLGVLLADGKVDFDCTLVKELVSERKKSEGKRESKEEGKEKEESRPTSKKRVNKNEKKKV